MYIEQYRTAFYRFVFFILKKERILRIKPCKRLRPCQEGGVHFLDEWSGSLPSRLSNIYTILQNIHQYCRRLRFRSPKIRPNRRLSRYKHIQFQHTGPYEPLTQNRAGEPHWPRCRDQK